MPSDNLNRDKLPGWNTPPENNAWTKIDNAVNAAAEAASIAPKIITPQKVPGALDVPNNTLERTKVASNTNGSVTVISIGEGGKVPLLKAPKKLPVKRFPPSFGIMFTWTPPVSVSAELAEYSKAYSWMLPSCRFMNDRDC